MRVLIIDNSEEIIERLEELLLETVSIAAIYKAVTYKEAIKLFKDHQPDAVLLDISLPGNKSFELYREIRKTGYKTSVIILSVRADSNGLEKGKLPRADFFLDKYHEFEKIPAIMIAIAGKILPLGG